MASGKQKLSVVTGWTQAELGSRPRAQDEGTGTDPSAETAVFLSITHMCTLCLKHSSQPVSLACVQYHWQAFLSCWNVLGLATYVPRYREADSQIRPRGKLGKMNSGEDKGCPVCMEKEGELSLLCTGSPTSQKHHVNHL